MIACVVCIVTSVVIVLTWRLIKTIRAGSANPDDIEFENPVRNAVMRAPPARPTTAKAQSFILLVVMVVVSNGSLWCGDAG